MDEWSKSSKAHSDAVAARDKTEAELKQAQLNKESLIESIGLFREAAVAGEIASKTLANDKELAAAAKTFQDKLKKLEVDAAEAGKAIAARMAAAETAAMAVEPARMAAELRKPAADEARAKIAVTEKARDLADASKRQARVAAQQAEQKVREAKALLAYSESLEAAAPLLKQVGKRRGEVSQMEGLIAVHRAALAANAAALVPLESSAAETLAAALKARKTLEDAAEQLATLMDASGKAGAVLGKFPADGEVQAATKTLQARCEQARNDRDAAQVMLDGAETAATAAAAAHGSRRKEATEAQAALSGEETQLAKLQIAAEEAASGAMPARALMESASRDLAAVGTTVFSVSNLAPLPPEQLCWSILQATGTLG